MKPLVDLLELGIGHVGIDLRGRDRGMSKELLDGTYIRTVCQQGSGEAMPKGVGRNLFDDIGTKGVLLDFGGNEEP